MRVYHDDINEYQPSDMEGFWWRNGDKSTYYEPARPERKRPIFAADFEFTQASEAFEGAEDFIIEE